MKITVDVEDQRITDLLEGHGGTHSPWIHELTGTWKGRPGLKVRYDREQDEEGEGKGRQTIRRKDVARGLATMIKIAPEEFADFILENDDDLTFDVFIQCIIFGKLVYA